MTDDLAGELRGYRPPAGTVALWWLGQSGFALRSASSGLILIDAYLSDSIAAGDPASIWQRAYPPPVAPAQLDTAVAMLCTHEHGDHFDPATLSAVLGAAPAAIVLLPAWMRESAPASGLPPERLRYLRGEGDAIELGGEIRVVALPAAHYALEHDARRGQRWLGYLIEIAGLRIYHSGDTLIYPGLAERLRDLALDLLILPINGRDAVRDAQEIVGNLWPAEAADLARRAAARLTVACHWDMFAVNGLSPGQIADGFVNADRRLPFKIMALGERLLCAP